MKTKDSALNSKPLFPVPDLIWPYTDLPLFEAVHALPPGFRLSVAGQLVIIDEPERPADDLDRAS